MELNTEEIQEKLGWLGRIERSETIGKYQVVTYYPYKLKDGDRLPGAFSKCARYHGFYDGRNFNTSYTSIEACLAGTMACVNDGINSKAAKYFCIAIGVSEFMREG